MNNLYAIIDRANLDLAMKYQQGGVTMLQYRAKNIDTRVMIDEARALKAALTIPLLINDRVDVALASHAEGVHLGQSDMHPRDARLLLGDKAIIGLTLKNAQHIIDAPVDCLDYACLGGVFETLSKHNPEPPLGLANLQNLVKLWRERTLKPIGAIAGINASNAASVMQTGVNFIAVISALSKAIEPEKAARALRAFIDRDIL
jgi:thiamine-phosphate diphosphorylase